MNTEPRKILIGVTSHTSVSFHKDLAVALSAAGFEVHVVSSTGLTLSQLPAGIITHELEMEREPNLIRDPSSFFNWLKLLHALKPDLVLAGTPKASLMGIMAAKFVGVPARVYFVHGLRLETSTGLKRRILWAAEALTAKYATSLVAVSSSLRDEILKLRITQSEKIVVIGSGSTQGVDLTKFKPRKSPDETAHLFLELGLEPERPTIGFIGRLTTDKGIAEFRDAVISMHRSGTRLQTLLVGSVEDTLGQGIVDELREAGVRVVATGQVDNTAPFFRAMDVFCLPSYREGLGNVILEAFASKVPVVGTRVTGIVDLIEDGTNGLLVPPKDAISLAGALEKLIDDTHLSARLAEAARTFVEEEFDSELVINRQVSFFRQELESNATTDEKH